MPDQPGMPRKSQVPSFAPVADKEAGLGRSMRPEGAAGHTPSEAGALAGNIPPGPGAALRTEAVADNSPAGPEEDPAGDSRPAAEAGCSGRRRRQGGIDLACATSCRCV